MFSSSSSDTNPIHLASSQQQEGLVKTNRVGERTTSQQDLAKSLAYGVSTNGTRRRNDATVKKLKAKNGVIKPKNGVAKPKRKDEASTANHDIKEDSLLTPPSSNNNDKSLANGKSPQQATVVVNPTSMNSALNANPENATTTTSPPKKRRRFYSIFERKRRESVNRKRMTSRPSTMPGFGSRSPSSSGGSTTKRQPQRLPNGEVRKPISEEERRRLIKEKTARLYRQNPSVPDSFVDFTEQIHEGTRLITPEEELALGNLTQEAVRLQSLFDKLEEKYGREPTDDEWCAAAGKINMVALEEAMSDGIEAKNKLVTANLRLVQGVVNVYLRNGLSGKYNVADMMSEGILALIRAAEKYDPKRGFRFSTYAMYWIRASVKRAQLSQGRVVSIPHRQFHTYKAITKKEQKFLSEYGRPPTMEELCSEMSMTEKQITRCKRGVSKKQISLHDTKRYRDKSGMPDSSGDMMDLVPDNSLDLEVYSVKRKFIRESLVDIMTRHLEPVEVRLLLLRFGLMEGKYYERPMTLAQVANAVGMKPDMARRRILGSLERLQQFIGEEWRGELRDLTQ